MDNKDHCNHEHQEHEHCNHEHHEHEHCDHGHNHEGIESHFHEEAVVCSGNREISGVLESIKEKLVIEIKSLAEWVEAQDGIIGHIKGYVEGGGMGYMLSTTGGEVQIKETQDSKVQVNIATIVFNVGIEELECRVASVFETL